ncbi:hypothetical protein [Nitrosomonas sp.]|uniref:hypothetical protein n=1 Tax=Nitrosomonas sp. TaxID=42353 RepID=UPI00374DE8BE
MKESHDSYANLYNHASIGYLTVDKTGHILFVNLTSGALLKMSESRISALGYR